MKISLVMDAGSPSFMQQAYELDAFLQRSSIGAMDVRLCLFYRTSIPERLPALSPAFSGACWIQTPENAPTETMILPLLAYCQLENPELVLFPGLTWGAELAVRLACRTGGVSAVGVQRAEEDSGELCVQKSTYGNHMLAMLALGRRPYCLSVSREGAKEAEPALRSDSVQAFHLAIETQPDWLKGAESRRTEEASSLEQASMLLAVGQGVGSAAGVQRTAEVADALGMAFGASRPVVMNAWCGMSQLLGMSGALTAPDLCLAAGVSGAPAFSVGIRHARFIVAINSDPQAAIFSQADVGIVDDMLPVLEALVECVQNESAA